MEINISEAWKIFGTGTVVAVIAYMLKNFTYEPLLEYKKTRGKIQNRLKYFGDLIVGGPLPFQRRAQLSSELRELSCELEERYSAISLARYIPTFLFIPTDSDIDEAATQLIFLSNNVGTSNSSKENNKAVDIIKHKLNIKARKGK